VRVLAGSWWWPSPRGCSQGASRAHRLRAQGDAHSHPVRGVHGAARVAMVSIVSPISSFANMDVSWCDPVCSGACLPCARLLGIVFSCLCLLVAIPFGAARGHHHHAPHPHARSVGETTLLGSSEQRSGRSSSSVQAARCWSRSSHSLSRSLVCSSNSLVPCSSHSRHILSFKRTGLVAFHWSVALKRVLKSTMPSYLLPT
jgi:hypothetical protein